MKLSEFKSHLLENSAKPVGFVFDDGEFIPGHFHVTEVGYVRKDFIDCGGTVRQTAHVQLQVWLGSDGVRRLPAGRLAKILDLGQALLPAEDLDVEVEYEGCVISQSTIESAELIDGQIAFRLGDKHTDCLAKEACGIPAKGEAKAAGCCDRASGCC